MKLFATLVSCFAIACVSRAASLTNGVSFDAFVRAAAPTLNYGSAGSLSLSGSASTNGAGVATGVLDSFIRFNTAAMVTNFNSRFGTNNWVISGAKLRITEMGAPPNTLFNRGTGAFEIRWMTNDNWIEGTGTPMTPTPTGINYNSESALLTPGTDAALGTFTNAGVDGVLSFALALPVAFINDLRAGGEVGFYLTAIDPGIGFTFNSRNFVTNSARPFLEISAVSQPGIVGLNLSGMNVILTATNGAADERYLILTSTNVTLPPSQWLPIETNVFATNGNFAVTLTNAANAAAPGSSSSFSKRNSTKSKPNMHDLTLFNWVILLAAVFTVAFFYSSVGHGGATGYLAALALIGVAPASARVAVLITNVLVASVAWWRFYRAGHFDCRVLLTFAVASVPCAWLGSQVHVSPHTYKLVLGAVLAAGGSVLLLRARWQTDDVELRKFFWGRLRWLSAPFSDSWPDSPASVVECF